MVHKMQRLAMTVSDASDDVGGSPILPVAAVPCSRQKCATIVEEAEIDDLDDDRDGADHDSNVSRGAKGRETNRTKKIINKSLVFVCACVFCYAPPETAKSVLRFFLFCFQ